MRIVFATATAILLGFSWVNAQAVVAPIVDLNDLPDNTTSSPSGEDVALAPVADSLSSRQSLPTDQRIRLLEQQISNLTQMNLPAKVDALTQQVNALNGQLEEQTHTIQQLQEQLQAKPPALAKNDATPSAPVVTQPEPTSPPVKKDKSKKSVENTPTATTNKHETNTTDSVLVAETAVVQNKTATPTNADATKEGISAEKAYQSAFDLMVKKQNTAAITAFKTFLKNHPNNATYTPSAHYWLGELYSTSNDKNAQASKEFTLLIQQYPHHAKVPDAMLKLAIMHDDAGQHAEAKQELQKVISQFPTSGAAKLAKMRLNSMKNPA